MRAHNWTKAAFLVAAATAISGCAGVSFYSDPGLKNKTGIPVYAPKPYLLVARTGAKDKPVEVSVIYLNDTSKVIYAKPQSGLGSAKLTLALTNGQMTSFGQDTDTKVPELITALSGMVTARAGAEKVEAEARKILSDIEQSADFATTGAKVKVVADDIEDAIKTGKLKGLSATELGDVKDAKAALDSAVATLTDPTKAPAGPAALEVVKAQAEALGKIGDNATGDARASAAGLVKTWAAELEALFDKAQPEKPPQATFELYEITQGASGTTLKRVNP